MKIIIFKLAVRSEAETGTAGEQPVKE